MALDSEQVVWVARIIRESRDSVVASLAAHPLIADEESILSDDIDLWIKIQNRYVKLKGGSDGIDLDNERKRAGIFYRVRQMLGYPFISYFLDAEVMELLELEVGQNFG
jgi:hypothetical protein